jgi:hypothetical protein
MLIAMIQLEKWANITFFCTLGKSAYKLGSIFAVYKDEEAFTVLLCIF